MQSSSIHGEFFKHHLAFGLESALESKLGAIGETETTFDSSDSPTSVPITLWLSMDLRSKASAIWKRTTGCTLTWTLTAMAAIQTVKLTSGSGRFDGTSFQIRHMDQKGWMDRICGKWPDLCLFLDLFFTSKFLHSSIILTFLKI